MPACPTMNPPVGKSGPLMRARRPRRFSSSLLSRCSMVHTMPSMTSRRLWGGMLVAMPTAMPAEPFTRRFGYGVGRTVGSSVVSS